MNAFACSLALSAGIAFTGPPAATERVETVLQDDAALLYRRPGARAAGAAADVGARGRPGADHGQLAPAGARSRLAPAAGLRRHRPAAPTTARR